MAARKESPARYLYV